MTGYLEGADAETFDLDVFLSGIDERLLASAEGRRILSRTCALTFALIYLPHHLRSDETGGVTFADFHLEVYRHARSWIRPVSVPASARDAWVAPRASGKSTLFYLVLPLWAACHAHAHFIAAFADSAPQAEQHLATFRHELETNELLRHDFPELCAPAKRPTGTTVSDNRHMVHQSNGFVFAARGVDSGVLGMKVGDRRPDVIVGDDVEPHEGVYSAYQAEKRRTTLLDAILPLNVFSRVVVVGTTVMAGSIVHQLVRTVTEPNGEHEAWVAEEGFRTHYFPPVVTRGDGSERSCWPAKWPMSYLESIRHTRSYAKNYANQPVNEDGDYWGPADFTYGDLPCARTLLSIDPATTNKRTSDPYGLSVVGYSPAGKKCVVRYAAGMRLSPAGLREQTGGLLARFPEVGAVLVETNTGGDHVVGTLGDLPVRILTVHQSESKEVRAARLLNHYQRGRVLHTQRLPALETEMKAFPKGLHDDMVDSTGSATWWFMDRKKAPAPSGTAAAYA